MKEIYLNTLSLLSDSLHDRVNTAVNADKWPEVFSELKAHAVVSLIAKNISNMDLSAEDKITFMKILGKSFQNYNNILLEQNRIMDSLRNEGINVAVLKGTSAAKYYPNPEYRAMGDIDIIVDPEDFNETKNIIASLGFDLLPADEQFERHVGFHNKNGLEIELHRHFSSVGTKEQRNNFDSRLYKGLENTNGSSLPEVENGLVLIGHVAHHLRSGLGLRQIIDWMMYAESNLTDKFWDEEFLVPARDCGFDKLAKVTTAVCRKYLGLSLDITWCDDVDEDLIDSFMEYVMDQGNFGRKHEQGERKSTTVLNNFRNPVTLFKYLQAGGKTHWKLARTNKFFGCFAWIYQIGHIVKMGFKRNVSIRNLKNINNESKKIVSLMDELEIKEY